jgi:hypothetical protein
MRASSILSHHGYKYYVLFTDQYTRYNWIYFCILEYDYNYNKNQNQNHSYNYKSYGNARPIEEKRREVVTGGE